MANYSLSEIDALSRKATRGAGYSWGIAEEVGKAVRWLSAYGFSGSEILAKHLEIVGDKSQNFVPNLENVTSQNLEFGINGEPLCSLYCATLINDLGHHLEADRVLSFSDMLFPLLALPAAGRIAEAYNISVSFTYAQTIINCDSTGIEIKDTPLLIGSFPMESNADVICSRIQSDFSNTHFPSPQGKPIADEALTVLEKFAHRTYAPDTEESRLRGAG